MDVCRSDINASGGVVSGQASGQKTGHFCNKSIVVNHECMTDRKGVRTFRSSGALRNEGRPASAAAIAGRVVECTRSGRAGLREKEFVRYMLTGNIVKLESLLVEDPQLMQTYPSCVRVRDKSGMTLAHRACLYDKPDCLSLILATDKGRRSLSIKDRKGRTPLHYAIVGSTECLERVLNEAPCHEALGLLDSAGGLPLHYMLNKQQWDISERIIRQMPESLLCKSGTTPTSLATIVDQYNTACREQTLSSSAVEKKEALKTLLNLALSYSRVAEQLCTVDDLLCLRIDHDPEMSATLTAMRQQYAAQPFKPVLFDAKEAGETSEGALSQRGRGFSYEPVVLKNTEVADHDKSQLIEALSLMASQDQTEAKARKIVRGLKRVGVYGRFVRFPGETKGNYYSFGDENASLQLIHQLVNLGCPNITCRLSPPQDARSIDLVFEVRKESLKQPGHLRREQENEAVVLHKLSYLLSGFDAGQGLPQTVQIGHSQVTFVRYDDPEPPCPLEVGFVNLKMRYWDTGSVPENYMNIKPYRFASRSQMLYTDIHDGRRGNVFPLNLPVNSLLPEHSGVTENPDVGSDITPRLFMRMGVRDKQLAQNLSLISQATQKKQLSSSVVYGLHHPKVSDEAITSKWIEALRGKAAASGRPVIIYISQSAMKKEGVQQALDEKGVPVMNMVLPETEVGLPALLAGAEVAVCELPSLPKPAFQYLLDSTDLPALVEGANTTSYLLERGHPYLSLLPEGRTAVPQEMGYPLEALKAEAFSYKLSFSSHEHKVLTELHRLLKEDQYHDAIKLLNDNEDVLKNIKFLYQPEKSDKRTGLRTITVPWLLAKGCEGRLGALEKEALLAAVDPSDTVLTDYIGAMGDKQSPTHNHFVMQQAHVGLYVNNALIAALNRFAVIKGLQV